MGLTGSLDCRAPCMIRRLDVSTPVHLCTWLPAQLHTHQLTYDRRCIPLFGDRPPAHHSPVRRVHRCGDVSCSIPTDSSCGCLLHPLRCHRPSFQLHSPAPLHIPTDASSSRLSTPVISEGWDRRRTMRPSCIRPPLLMLSLLEPASALSSDPPLPLSLPQLVARAVAVT
jgi:hypothetical protein